MAGELKFKPQPSTVMIAGPVTVLMCRTEKLAEIRALAKSAGIPVDECLRQMVDFALANR